MSFRTNRKTGNVFRMRRIREGSRVICPEHGCVAVVASTFRTGKAALEHVTPHEHILPGKFEPEPGHKCPKQICFVNKDLVFRA